MKREGRHDHLLLKMKELWSTESQCLAHSHSLAAAGIEFQSSQTAEWEEHPPEGRPEFASPGRQWTNFQLRVSSSIKQR